MPKKKENRGNKRPLVQNAKVSFKLTDEEKDAMRDIGNRYELTQGKINRELTRAFIAYEARDGEVALPLAVISARDFQAFQEWQAGN